MNRIPDLSQISDQSARDWMQTMLANGLFFHPDDDPAEIISSDTDQYLFDAHEAACLREILLRTFSELGDRVYEIGCAVLGISGYPEGA